MHTSSYYERRETIWNIWLVSIITGVIISGIYDCFSALIHINPWFVWAITFITIIIFDFLSLKIIGKMFSKTERRIEEENDKKEDNDFSESKIDYHGQMVVNRAVVHAGLVDLFMAHLADQPDNDEPEH